MEALRRSAPVPITFEAMAADTDAIFLPIIRKLPFARA